MRYAYDTNSRIGISGTASELFGRKLTSRVSNI